MHVVEAYLRAQGAFRDYHDAAQDPDFSETLELDLGTIVPAIAGPKRPQDHVALSNVKADFLEGLARPVNFKSYGVAPEQLDKVVPIELDGHHYQLRHGSVLIAAITSCTNTSNPNVMIAAGLLAKKAVERGLHVDKIVKTSLAPGSGVVTQYLEKSGLLPFLEQLGFNIVGYGCTTCIGNSGPLPDVIAEAVESNDLVCCGVLSGNRNFEGRIHPVTRANYLARYTQTLTHALSLSLWLARLCTHYISSSPPLVVAYALAGNVGIDFDHEPIGKGSNGEDVFLRDIWPTHAEVAEQVQTSVLPHFFTEVYSRVTVRNEHQHEHDHEREEC